MRNIAEDLWVVDAEQKLPGGIDFGARMTVVRTEDGALWLHSPVPIDDETAREIDALGRVDHIIAPNLFHSMYVAAGCRRWPDAHLHAPEGLADKREDLRVHTTLTDDSQWPGIESILVGGAPKVRELVFFHRPSATLIVTDLAFNLQEYEGWITGFVLALIGARKRYTQSKSWRWVFVKEREAAAESARRILAWPFARVVLSHGEIVETDAHARTREALSWMLAG